MKVIDGCGLHPTSITHRPCGNAPSPQIVSDDIQRSPKASVEWPCYIEDVGIYAPKMGDIHLIIEVHMNLVWTESHHEGH